MSTEEIRAVLSGTCRANVWWVYQRQTFHTTAQRGGYLWHHTSLPADAPFFAVQPGDVLLHWTHDGLSGLSRVSEGYRETPRPLELKHPTKDAGEPGYLIRIDYYTLARPIPLDAIDQGWRSHEATLHGKDAPFLVDGRLRAQGWVHPLSSAFVQHLVGRFPASFAALTRVSLP